MTLSARCIRAVHTELMLRHKQAPGDIMESLVAGIFEILKLEGIRECSLGEVPFKTLMQGEREALDEIELLMVSLAAQSRHAYDFEGLYRFKNKFVPQWRPVLLCSSIEPTPLLLAELAVSMGFAGLLMHESLGLLGRKSR